jgi:septal ring-binding cell division protein DamX
LIVALIVVFIVAGLSYAGYYWWSGRQEGEAVAAPIPVRKPAPPPTATQAAAQTTAPPPTETAPPPTTTTVAAVPVPQPQAAPKPPAPRTPAPQPPTDIRSRYEAMARDFAASPTGNFTVQFAIVCEPSNVTKALNSGGKNVWFVPITIKERSCYRMFWGRYETREAGERDVANLPAALRESRPSVVAIPR